MQAPAMHGPAPRTASIDRYAEKYLSFHVGAEEFGRAAGNRCPYRDSTPRVQRFFPSFLARVCSVRVYTRAINSSTMFPSAPDWECSVSLAAAFCSALAALAWVTFSI